MGDEIFQILCNNYLGVITVPLSEGSSVQRQIIFRQIGAKIAYYRTLRCMKQDELADKLHIDKSVLSRIERGKYHNNISVSMLLAIADGLQIDPALFLTFTDLEKRLWWEDLSAETLKNFSEDWEETAEEETGNQDDLKE